jgi:hypothetical protein
MIEMFAILDAHLVPSFDVVAGLKCANDGENPLLIFFPTWEVAQLPSIKLTASTTTDITNLETVDGQQSLNKTETCDVPKKSRSTGER